MANLSQEEVNQFDTRRTEALLTYNFPVKWICLTYCELAGSGEGLLYYMESDRIYSQARFTDEDSFQAACKHVATEIIPLIQTRAPILDFGVRDDFYRREEIPLGRDEKNNWFSYWF